MLRITKVRAKRDVAKNTITDEMMAEITAFLVDLSFLYIQPFLISRLATPRAWTSSLYHLLTERIIFI
jgi:hypothetical protein